MSEIYRYYANVEALSSQNGFMKQMTLNSFTEMWLHISYHIWGHNLSIYPKNAKHMNFYHVILDPSIALSLRRIVTTLLAFVYELALCVAIYFYRYLVITLALKILSNILKYAPCMSPRMC